MVDGREGSELSIRLINACMLASPMYFCYQQILRSDRPYVFSLFRLFESLDSSYAEPELLSMTVAISRPNTVVAQLLPGL